MFFFRSGNKRSDKVATPSTSRTVKRRRRSLFLEALEDRTLPATVTWTGLAGDNSFQDAGNWSPTRVPGATDDAVINASGITITESGTETVLSLQSNAALDITAGSLEVTSGLTITGGTSLTASGSGTSFTASGTTNIDGASLLASDGATLSLPQLTSYTADANTFQADGTGSVLDVSALAKVTQPGYLSIQATNGGEVKLSSLTSLAGVYASQILDIGGSTILDPKLTSLDTTSVTLDGSDSQVANAWTTFTNGALNVMGGSYSLPSLADVDGSNLSTESGGSLALPGLTSYSSNNSTFQSDGSGSVLDVSALAKVTQQPGYWSVDATDGGEINLSSLTNLAGVFGSQILDIGGSTILDHKLISLDTTSATFDGTDSQVANAWTTFTNGTLNVTGGATSLPALTDLNGSNLNAQSGGSLALPVLTSYTSEGNTFQADGSGSVVDVSALAKVTQTGYLNIQATNGGKIALSSLTSLAGVFASVITDIGGSTVLDAKLTSLDTTTVTLDGSDSQVANAWTTFTNGNLTVTGGTTSLADLGNATGSKLAVQSGASLSVPASTTGGTYTISPSGTLIVGSDDVTPTSLAVPSAFANDNWAGTFSGTASDASGTGLASVGVSFFDGSHYFDGTAFESTTPVYLPTTLSGTDWTLTIPIADFPTDVSCTVASQALDNAGGVESSAITSLVLTQKPPVVTAVVPVRGLVSGGTTVTITGTFLSHVVAVDFGPGNPGTIVSDSPGTLVATSPAGTAGTINIIVTTAEGASTSSDDDHFTYFLAPMVSMTAPANGSDTNNNKPTLSATASDDNGTGLASVQFEYSSNGGTTWNNAGAAETSGPFNFTFSTALADGTYEARAVATDNTSDSTTSSAVTFTIDTVAPTVALSAPANGSYTNVNKPTLTAAVSDNTGGSGLASVQFEYSSNGGTSWTNAGAAQTSGPFSFTFSTKLADGTYEARAVATDNASNSTTSTVVSFTIDTVAPTVALTAPVNGSYTNFNKPTLTATASDNTGGSGLASVQFEYSNNGGTSWNNAGAAEMSGPFSFTFATALSDGTYEARAVATDNASNSTTSSAVSFTIDTIAPTVAMTAPPNGSATNVNKPTLTATASDNTGGSGLASVQFEYSSNGGTTWTNAGAAETSGPFSFTFSNPLADGTYEARAIATDNASNSTTSTVVSFAIDTIAPTIAMTAPANGSYTNVNKPTLTATASDNTGGSGLASVQFEYSNNGGTTWTKSGAAETSGPFSFTFATALADGTYEARAVATDNASNSTTSSAVSFTIDTVAPTVALTAPANGTISNDNEPTLTATAADNTGGSGLASVQIQYSSNNGTSWTNAGAAQTSGPFSFTFTTALSDGTYEARAIATDNASNSTTSTVVSFTIDTVAPMVTLTAPANGSYTNINKPTLTATASDNTGGSGLASVQFEYSSNGGTTWSNAGAAETSGPFSFTFTTALANGIYEARAVATDNASNSTTSSVISFTIDTVAPTVALTAPANGTISNDNEPTLTATAADNTGGSGLASIQFEYSSNGGTSWNNAGAAQTSAPFSFTLTTALADGTHEARAVATDNASNSTTSSVISFTIDTVAPTVALTAPANGTISNDNEPTLTATAADNTGGSGLASVQFEYSSNGGTSWTNAGAAESSGPFSFSFSTALADGTYEARAVATDNAGNSTSSSAVTFTIDTVAPTVAMTAPANGSDSTNTKPTLTATASDNTGGSGLASVQFEYSNNGGTSWNNAGAAQTSGPFSFTFTTGLANGTYEARAVAIDNAGNSTTSTPVFFGINVVQASPSLSTTPGGTIVLGSGGKLTDSATLSKGSNPSGMITFTLFAPDGVTIVNTETAAVSGNGTYKTPTGYLPVAVGTYQWVASYSGDGANKAVTSTKGAEKVSVAIPTISATPSGPVVLGSNTRLTDSAALSGGYNPSGKIIFVLFAPNGRSVDTESVTVSGDGTYSTPTGYLPSSTAGTYQWVVSYSGDSNNKAVSSSLGSEPATVIGTGVTVVGKTLYLVGGKGDDHIQIASAGNSATGSTGVKINADLNGVSIAKTYLQSFTTLFVYGFGGNDSIQSAGSLTVNTVVNEGDGNDNVQLGGGNNSVTLGNGNDTVQVGNGNNVVVTGNGNDILLAGNGDNLIAAGLGQHSVVVGNGSNILIDGSVALTQSGDSLAAVLADWAHSGNAPANVVDIHSRLAVTDNSSNANLLVAGSGLDWFFETFGKDATNKKATDLLN